MFVVGFNSPGYLPDSAPDEVEDYGDAVALLCENITGASLDRPISLDEGQVLAVVLDDAREAPSLGRPIPLGYTLRFGGVEEHHFLAFAE